MGSSRRAAIWRRLAVLTALARDTVRRRQGLRERAAVWDVIRPALAASRIDPARLKQLWPVTTAAKTLAGLGDSPILCGADAAFIAHDPVLVSRRPYAAGAAARMPRFRNRPPPQPDAALFDWYAWSLARVAVARACPR